MDILEIKSINHGSTDYVSGMLLNEFKKLNKNVSVIPSIRKLSKNPFSWYSFYKKCKGHEILHCHLGRASQFTSYFKGKSIQVSTLHGFQKAKHYKNSDYYTAVSSVVKEHYIKQGIPADKIKVIPNGVKRELLDIDLNKNNKITTIAQIGHLTKNIDFTFLIIKKLANLGYKFKFIFVGDQGNIDLLREKIKKLEIEKYVEFLGFVFQIENIYKNIDILFSSSILEGFCLPILESMASGIPVVTYDNKGINDYFHNEINGYIFDNETDAVKYLEKLILDSKLRLAIAKRNRLKAMSYTWDKIALEYINYFISLNKKKKGVSFDN